MSSQFSHNHLKQLPINLHQRHITSRRMEYMSNRIAIIRLSIAVGAVFWTGSAEPDTGIPGTIKGEGIKRVVKAPCGGIFQPTVEIGDAVEAGDLIAHIDETEVHAQLSGIVRGIIYPGITVWEKLKIMDIDPRGNRDHCFTVSDKATALGGGVLEAILTRF